MMLLVLPLRIPLSDVNLEQQIANWIDYQYSMNKKNTLSNQNQNNNNNLNQTPNDNVSTSINFTSKDCKGDIQYLIKLRNRISKTIQQYGFQSVSSINNNTTGSTTTNNNSPNGVNTSTTADNNNNNNNNNTSNSSISISGLTIGGDNNNANTSEKPIPVQLQPLPVRKAILYPIDRDLREYAAILKDCEEHGFPITDTQCYNSNNNSTNSNSSSKNTNNYFFQMTWIYRNEVETAAATAGTATATATAGTSDTLQSNNPNDSSANINMKNKFIEVQHNLRWERANVIWNLATLECYKAAEILHPSSVVVVVSTDTNNTSESATAKPATTTTTTTTTTNNTNVLSRSAWSKAGQHLQNAANLIRYLRLEIVIPLLQSSNNNHNDQYDTDDYGSSNNNNKQNTTSNSSITSTNNTNTTSYLLLSPFFLELWECFCIAEAQRSAYETFRIAVRPNYTMVARLAAGTAPLYQYVEDLCQSNDTERLLNTCNLSSTTTGSTNTTPGDDNDNNDNTTTTTTMTTEELDSNTSNQQLVQQQQQPPLKLDAIIMDWEDTVRAWGMWMTSVTEYYQSLVHNENNEYGIELARLEAAIQFGGFCKEFCESGADSDLLDTLALVVMPTMEEMEERYEHGLQLNKEQYKQEIPDHDELQEIQSLLAVVVNSTIETVQQQKQSTNTTGRNNNNSMYSSDEDNDDDEDGNNPRRMISDFILLHNNNNNNTNSSASGNVQIRQQFQNDISRLLPSANRSMFATTISDPIQRRYADIFRREMNYIVEQHTAKAEKETEYARQALAKIRLPHSVTIYKQEQDEILLLHRKVQQELFDKTNNNNNNNNNNQDTSDNNNNNRGIPDELWKQIEQYQNESVSELLQDEIQYIRKCSTEATIVYDKMISILDEDIIMDKLFREIYTNFIGHNVIDIQRSFRLALTNYNRLLVAATDSNTLLQRRCTVLEFDPKFRLLKLSKTQLQRILLPDTTANALNNSFATNTRQQQQQQQYDDDNNGGSYNNNDSNDDKEQDIEDLTDDTDDEIDVSILSKYLADLSILFTSRETIIHSLKERTKQYNIVADFQAAVTDLQELDVQYNPSHNNTSSNPNNPNKHLETNRPLSPQLLEHEYKRVIDDAKIKLKDLVHELTDSYERQRDLLEEINKENDIFVMEWEQVKSRRVEKLQIMKQQQQQSHNSQNSLSHLSSNGENNNNNNNNSSTFSERDNLISKIEDALEDVNQFLKHLKEGREFYDVIIPKLNKLKVQVDDVSTRLTTERSDFEKRHSSTKTPTKSSSSSSTTATTSSFTNNTSTQSSTTGSIGQLSSSRGPISGGGGSSVGGGGGGSHSGYPTNSGRGNIGNSPASSYQRPVHSGSGGGGGNNNDEYLYDRRGSQGNGLGYNSSHGQTGLRQPTTRTGSTGGGIGFGGGYPNNNIGRPIGGGSGSSVGSFGGTGGYYGNDQGSGNRYPPSRYPDQQEYSQRDQFGGQQQGIGRNMSNGSSGYGGGNRGVGSGGSISGDSPYNNNTTGSRRNNSTNYNNNTNNSGVVDDEKVASLIAMDFPPDRVVNALLRYDNNIEQALNHLLSNMD